MALDYVKIRFHFTLTRNIEDRYLLFGCRAGFAAAFRTELSCATPDCSRCSVTDCPYPANFGQALSSDPEAVRRHQKPPLPFVFTFPVLPGSPNRGKCLSGSLAIFGCAIQQLELYLKALRRLLGELGATLTALEALAPSGEAVSLPLPDAPLTAELPILRPFEADPVATQADRLVLELITPLRLQQSGGGELAFPPLIGGLMRRASALACYYGACELPLDYRWLAQQSAAVAVTRSDCRPVSWGRNRGLVGNVTFCGPLEEFRPLLLLGETLQLGKGAAFGLGAFRVAS